MTGCFYLVFLEEADSLLCSGDDTVCDFGVVGAEVDVILVLQPVAGSLTEFTADEPYVGRSNCVC